MAGPVRRRGVLKPNELACSWCAYVLVRHEVETKIPDSDLAKGAAWEFIGTAQARYTCPMCGLGMVFERDHKEHREAREEQERLQHGGAA